MTRAELEKIKESTDRLGPGAKVLLRRVAGELKSGKINTGDVYTALHILGEGGLQEEEDLVAGYLDSSDPELRHIALSVLVLHWGLRKYSERCEDLLVSDEDLHVRTMAADCLGSMLQESKDRPILQKLAQVVNDSHEDDMVRGAAYRAILRIANVPLERRPPGTSLLRIPDDIDWDIVESAGNAGGS